MTHLTKNINIFVPEYRFKKQGNMSDEVHKGLDDVVVAESQLSYIDGENGQLLYRGYSIQDLAEYATFEEVLFLLFEGELPTKEQLDEFTATIREERSLPDDVIETLRSLAAVDAHPMTALRTGVSALEPHDPDQRLDPDRNVALSQGRRILAKMPTILAAYERLRLGKEPLDPHPDLNLAANFLYMLTGEEPDEIGAKSFDQALTLHADHGFNASTFTAVVIASTRANVYSAVTGGIGALSGPLHGGANQDVMEMLIEIDENGMDPIEWIEEARSNGERVPGFGHRVYKVKDPRAEILQERSRELADVGESKWYDYTTTIENYLTEDLDLTENGIAPNVDFYSGSVYYQLGIPADMYTPIFAMSRASGWIAHVLEYQEENRLIRPLSKYTGETDNEFISIEER